MKIITKIEEVRPRIFLFKFKDSYDMSMSFLRFQEYYELPNKKFRRKQFKIVDYMEWYSKKYGNGIFTYPNGGAEMFEHGIKVGKQGKVFEEVFSRYDK